MLSLFSQLAPMGKFSQPHISSKERFELNLKFSRDSVFLPSHLLAVPPGESSIIQLRWVAANYVVCTRGRGVVVVHSMERGTSQAWYGTGQQPTRAEQ